MEKSVEKLFTVLNLIGLAFAGAICHLWLSGAPCATDHNPRAVLSGKKLGNQELENPAYVIFPGFDWFSFYIKKLFKYFLKKTKKYFSQMGTWQTKTLGISFFRTKY